MCAERKLRSAVVFACILFVASAAKATDAGYCQQYNYHMTSTQQIIPNGLQHITGTHTAKLQAGCSCKYSGPNYQLCNVALTASGYGWSSMTDDGYLLYDHTTALGFTLGTANGPSPQSGSAVTVGAVRSCLVPPCDLTVGVSYPPIIVNYNPANSALWAVNQVASFTCAPAYGQCKEQNCPPRWEWINCHCVYLGGSPIIIDTRNQGFHLSRPSKTDRHDGKGRCAPFDLRGDGKKECWSWPEVGSGNGWLVYPHRTNAKVLVASGKDLFGNFTKQPEHRDKNGYSALMEFIEVQNGGYVNPDGSVNYIVDARDAVWEKLRIWIPEDYSGVAKERELHKLSEFNIHSISTIPAQYEKKDQWGNSFLYGAPLNIEPDQARDWAAQNDARSGVAAPHELNTQTYDVWLMDSTRYKEEKETK